MKEEAATDFWLTLEYRVCDELSRIEATRRLGLWCDGFIPETQELMKGGLIRGSVWIGKGSRDQFAWEFVARFSKAPQNTAIPGPDSHDWIRFDTAKSFMELDFRDDAVGIDPGKPSSPPSSSA